MAAPRSQPAEFLNRHGLRPIKSRGQHFLINLAIADRIVAAANLGPDSVVLEVGPGTGVLTSRLMAQARHVYAVEIDRRLAEALQNEYRDASNLTVLPNDILKMDVGALCTEAQTEHLTVVANLPYNITGPILDRLILFNRSVSRAILMTQQEVGERLAAQPGTKSYGAVTVIMSYIFRLQALFPVGPASFLPKPSVQSLVLGLEPYSVPPVDVSDPRLLVEVIRSGFLHRRKMLLHAVNRFGDGAIESVVEQTGLDLKRRGETLTLNEFALLTDAITAFQRDRSPNAISKNTE